jgi:hypothetical protein
MHQLGQSPLRTTLASARGLALLQPVISDVAAFAPILAKLSETLVAHKPTNPMSVGGMLDEQWRLAGASSN